jgi:hypothetical protein
MSRAVREERGAGLMSIFIEETVPNFFSYG